MDITEAARAGDIGALARYRAEGGQWSAKLCDEAAESGRLEVLRWLRSQDPPCPWGAHTCVLATWGGHLEVLEWLRAQDPPCPWDSRVCWLASIEGHLRILESAVAGGCPVDLEGCKRAAKTEEVRQWLEAYGAPEDVKEPEET